MTMGFGIKTKLKKTYQNIKKPKLIPIIKDVSSSKEFYGKTALISGGTGGIGYAIAKSLLESGCNVIVAGTNQGKLEEMQHVENSDKLKTIKLDYTDIDKLEENIMKAVKYFGKIDIFISSSGVHTEKANFWNITSKEYDRVMNINLKGTFFACQIIARYMCDNHIKGKILLISSSRGSEPAWSPYGISKWGMRGLTEGLAQILIPYGIGVNAIAPGSTATELIGVGEGDNIASDENKIGRYIMPEEVANLAKYLVSDAGCMIIGETIHLSGGRGIIDIR